MTTPGQDFVALRRRISHTCPICGQVFTAYTTAMYCSNKCRQAAKYARAKAAQIVTRNTSVFGASSMTDPSCTSQR